MPHSLIIWLIVSSLSPHNLHLLFCQYLLWYNWSLWRCLGCYKKRFCFSLKVSLSCIFLQSVVLIVLLDHALISSMSPFFSLKCFNLFLQVVLSDLSSILFYSSHLNISLRVFSFNSTFVSCCNFLSFKLNSHSGFAFLPCFFWRTSILSPTKFAPT